MGLLEKAALRSAERAAHLDGQASAQKKKHWIDPSASYCLN